MTVRKVAGNLQEEELDECESALLQSNRYSQQYLYVKMTARPSLQQRRNYRSRWPTLEQMRRSRLPKLEKTARTRVRITERDPGSSSVQVVCCPVYVLPVLFNMYISICELVAIFRARSNVRMEILKTT